MKLFRQIFFWLHLVAGLLAGIVIAVMAFTGAALAFEKEIVAWAERDVARVTVPANGERLSLDELQQRVRTANPEARANGITVKRDQAAAVLFSAGREGGSYADPYTGAVSAQGAVKTRAFMHTMTDLHRFLGAHGESTRPVGKAVTGACNLAFLFLGVSGLYLWWPRSWSWRGFKAIAVVNLKASGKARDWNWHNAIGLWCAPVLIVLTLTALPISYRWAGNLIFTLTGTELPATGTGPGAGAGPTVEVPKPAPGTKPLGYDALLRTVHREVPDWEQIAFRTGGARGGTRPAGGAPVAAPVEGERRAEAPRDGGAQGSARPSGGEAGRGENRGPQAITATVRSAGTWPRTATTTLSLDPFTGEVLRREGFGDQNAARQVRSWTRFLHTGEALGWGGQFIAGVACLGGLFLCWTGFALAWRRFFGRGNGSSAATAK